jgi:DNA-binding transcriptional MerR regulator
MSNEVATMQLHGISGAARKVPCAEGTLRSLERRQVIQPIRDSAGRRLFSEDDIKLARDYLGRTDGRDAA